LLAGLYLALLVSLYCTTPYLPETVATHFNANGTADGWMSRSTHLVSFAFFGLLFPAVMIGLCYAVRFFPPSMLNLPNRNYWTAPERITETHNRIFHHSIWFGCFAVAFIIGLHFTLVEANSHPRPALSLSMLVPVTVTFLACALLWTLKLILPFRRIPESN
jgi:serine/threonine-protein kinase